MSIMTTALRHNIDHEISKNGIVYKIAKTPEEFALVMDFLFDVFAKGEKHFVHLSYMTKLLTLTTFLFSLTK